MIYFLSALAGAFLMSVLFIAAVCWDECDGQMLLLEGFLIISGVIVLSIARSIGG